MTRAVSWLLLALTLLSPALGCGSSSGSASYLDPPSASSSIPDELADGTYECEAYNATRGNGPYDLECEKSGDEIVIHFNNGGHITLDIDSQTSSDGSTWTITGTHYDRGEEWELTVAR